MCSAEIEKSQRLLRLTFAQRVERDELAACADQIQKLVAAAEPGFSLLTDLTKLECMEIACEPIIDQIMDACNQAGVRKVVRVVPNPNRDIGFGIMSLFHYGHDVHIVTCSTLEEAEGALKSS